MIEFRLIMVRTENGSHTEIDRARMVKLLARFYKHNEQQAEEAVEAYLNQYPQVTEGQLFNALSQNKGKPPQKYGKREDKPKEASSHKLKFKSRGGNRRPRARI